MPGDWLAEHGYPTTYSLGPAANATLPLFPLGIGARDRLEDYPDDDEPDDDA
jgi:hypothetical protein